MIFAIIMIAVFLGAPIYHFYDIYQNRKIPRGEVLFSAYSSKKGWFTLKAFSSIFTGFITLFLIIVFTVATLRGYKATVIEWLLAASAIIFFSVLSFDSFPTKRKRTLHFSDKGIVYDNMFYSWDEIEWYEWRVSSDGKTFTLNICLRGWYLKRTFYSDYFSFDTNAKQNIDKILEGRVRIRT